MISFYKSKFIYIKHQLDDPVLIQFFNIYPFPISEFTAKSSLSRASVSLKNEVTKLRDMIHKLEKENQDLQHQAKLHWYY